MRTIQWSIGIVALSLVSGAAAADDQPLELRTQVDKLSYVMGARFANTLKQDGVEVNVAAFARAMEDVLADRPLLLTEQEVAEAITEFGADRRAHQEQAEEQVAAAHREAGLAFRREYAEREGVVALPSGLLYRVLREGAGPTPGPGATVRAHYRGTLIDGTEFDSSYRRGRPATFALANVIPGWQEALQLMPVGAKWEVVIPPDLAYGVAGAPPTIPPNATLIFQIELLEIVQPQRDAQ